jgi:spermidine synthase
LPAAFVAGAAVMLYELVAVRILQRDFGGTMDVWASEIAVCLAALAAGYALGGRIADRMPSPRAIGLCLVLGGAFGFTIEPLARWAGSVLLESPVPLRVQPLIAAGVCTALPILLLGVVLPLAIRLRTGHPERVGRSVGDVATISTLGSIVGVLAPALYLFHEWGVREVLWFGAGATALTGLIVAVAPLRRTAMTAIALAAASPAFAQPVVHFDTYSAYHHIRVVDNGGVRSLMFDDYPQSLMRVDDPYAGGFEYTDFFHVPLVFRPSKDPVLFIGLGGGTGPKSFLRYEGIRIDVAEIDPAVVKVARTYFAVPEDPRLKIQVGDGRAVLRRARAESYSAVIMDAYATGPTGAYLPYHLATEEFFQIAREKLRDGGSVVFNAIGLHGNDPNDVLRHLLVTMESVFEFVYVFQARSSLNTVFVAVKAAPVEGSPAGSGEEEAPAWPYGAPFLNHPVSGREMAAMASQLRSIGVVLPGGLEQRLTQVSGLQSAPRTGEILTDNYAPVDISAGSR